MSDTGALSVEVDTVINPYTVGINSPSLTLVQAIDFIGYDPRSSGGPEGIKYIDNGAKTLATFGLVDKIDIASVSPLVDAATKYLAAPAGTKLVTKAYNFIVSEDDRNAIIDANTAPAYCLRIRTVMVDTSLPSSPAVPNNIVEFNTLVESLGSAQSTYSGHNLYYGCISIPVNGVGRPFLKIDPVMYYDWGSMNDYGIKVTGTSSKSVLPPIQMIFTWNDAHSPTMTISQDGESWEAYINSYDPSYLYIGPDWKPEWSCNFKVTYEDPETGLTAGIDTVSEGRLPPKSRAIRIGDVGTQIEHIRDYNPPTNKAYEELPVANYDFATGKLSLDTIVKLNRADEIALNGNDLELWVKVHFIPHVDGSSYRLDTVSTSSELSIRPGLEIYGLGSLWNDPARRVPYNSVYDGGPEGWQIVKTEMLSLSSLQGDIDLLRAASGDTNTKYVMIVQTIVTRNNSNPPVPYPPNLDGYDTFFQSQAMFDYRNVSYFSINVPYVAVEDDFTLNDVTFYEYGSTSNRTLTISGTATGEVTKDNLVIEGFSETSGAFVPLNIESVSRVANVWQAKVTNPNPALRIVPITNEYGEYFGGKITDVMKASYTSSITGAVKESGNKNITMRGPIMTRVVNMDSPATTHNIVYNGLVEYGLFKPMLPYARFDASTNTFSLDVVVKTKNPDEIAAMGADMKLWIKLELEALGVGQSKYSKGPYIYLDEPIGPWTDNDTGVTMTGPVYTVGKTLHIVPNLWAIWNDPSVSKPYSDKFPDAPDNAKQWRILTIEVPIGDISSEIAAARAATGNVETDLLVVMETFMARTDMDLPAPYPSTFDGFTEDYYSTFQYPAERDSQRRISYLKVNIPIPAAPEPEPIREETFTVDKPYYYEYGSTANPTVVISGTASGPISVADLFISVLDGDYVDQPLTIHSVDKVGDKWTAVVSDPNLKKVIPGPMHKAYSATDYTTKLFTKLEATFRYINPTSGKMWETYTDDIYVHCPTQTRAVNLDSPRTTHEVINSFRGGYPSEVGHTGWWSDLPYARLDLDTGVLSVDVIVKLVKPEEIALNGNGLKLWVRTQMDLDTNLTSLVSFDAKKLVTDNALTLNKSLAVIDNLGDIWNDPTKVQPYIDKFPDAPVEAKDWKIVKVDIPLGSNFKADTNAARTALGFASLPTTDLLLTIHTFIGRTDMSRTPPYPDTIEAFNKAFIDSLTRYPYTFSNDNTLVMRSHLKIDLPV